MAKHLVVIYFGANKDWSSIQLERNGHKYFPLVSVEEPQACVEYWSRYKRAMSLQYDGIKSDLAGMVEDLKHLGFDQEAVLKFKDAAETVFNKRLALQLQEDAS